MAILTTLDPAYNSGFILSSDKLSTTGGGGNIALNTVKSEGKWYVEIVAISGINIGIVKKDVAPSQMRFYQNGVVEELSI